MIMEKKKNQKRAVWAPGQHLHKGSVLSCQLPQWSLSQIHTTTTTILTQSTLTEWQKAAWPLFVIKKPTFVCVLCVYFSDFCHAKGQASVDEHAFGLPEVSKCAKRWRLSSLTRASGRYGASEFPRWRDFILDAEDATFSQTKPRWVMKPVKQLCFLMKRLPVLHGQYF